MQHFDLGDSCHAFKFCIAVGLEAIRLPLPPPLLLLQPLIYSPCHLSIMDKIWEEYVPETERYKDSAMRTHLLEVPWLVDPCSTQLCRWGWEARALFASRETRMKFCVTVTKGRRRKQEWIIFFFLAWIKESNTNNSLAQILVTLFCFSTGHTVSHRDNWCELQVARKQPSVARRQSAPTVDSLVRTCGIGWAAAKPNLMQESKQKNELTIRVWQYGYCTVPP